MLDVCKLQSKVNFVKGYFSFSTFFNMIGERLRSFPSEQYIPVSCCELRWKYFRKVHSEVGMDKIKAVKSSPLLSMSCITMVFGCLGSRTVDAHEGCLSNTSQIFWLIGQIVQKIGSMYL